ncbi:MAG: ABC transporter permease [Promethearchaeota archaeon]
MFSLSRSLSHLTTTPLFLIIVEEIKITIKTNKFKLLVLILIIPVIIQLLSREEIVSQGSDICLEKFQEITGSWILNFWTAWAVQIVIILLSSEFIAGEYEQDTLRILLTKPIKRSEILLGKYFGFLLYIFGVFSIALISLALILVWEYGGDVDTFLKICQQFLLPGLLVLICGVLLTSSLTTIFSATFRRSLFASLTSLFLFFGHMFIGPILFGSESHFTLQYQLGILLENYYQLSPTENVYLGDPLTAFSGLIGLSLLFLTIALLAFYRRDI